MNNLKTSQEHVKSVFQRFSSPYLYFLSFSFGVVFLVEKAAVMYECVSGDLCDLV